MRLQFWAIAVLPFLTYGLNADPTGGGNALYPPGLQPLISRANVLLSAAQFSDAAKAYSEAIGKPSTTVAHARRRSHLPFTRTIPIRLLAVLQTSHSLLLHEPPPRRSRRL